jgi:type IV pilus biogenesis protein CpaD/CtpE
VWHPVGANAANLTAMVANPQDLQMGRGARSSPGDQAGVAAIRLRTGTVRKLPASSISKVQATDQSSGSDAQSGPSAAAPVAAGGPAAGAGQ